jgi:uncharacterized protein (UPF0261 family)
MSLHRLIAITIDPATEIGALHASEHLRRNGWRSQLFLMTPTDDGGLERSILDNNNIYGVLEYSLVQLAAQLIYAETIAPYRMTAAAQVGIPQVIVPGSIDHVQIHDASIDTGERKRFVINESSVCVRTNADDNDFIGKEVAFKASASKGKVSVVLPLGGYSNFDEEGKPGFDSFANRTFVDSLLLWKSPHVPFVESNRHINDDLFAQIAVDQLLKLLVSRT